MPRHLTSPTVNSRPTRPLSWMPRVTTLRRCSFGASGGSNDSHTSASISVSALPGRPDGKVPVPTTCRSPSSPRPVRARARRSDCAGSPAAGATQIASTRPEAAGAASCGGRASAMSAAATRNPSSIEVFSIEGPPEGSHTAPDGTPYMTTYRGPSLPPARTRAIHGPAHENEAGSAIRAIPRPSPPSQRDTVHPAAGSSSAAGSGNLSSGSSRIVAKHARNDAVARDSPDLGRAASFTTGSWSPQPSRRQDRRSSDICIKTSSGLRQTETLTPGQHTCAHHDLGRPLRRGPTDWGRELRLRDDPKVGVGPSCRE